VIVTIQVFGAKELAARWAAKVATLPAEIEVGVSTDAQALLSRIKARAPVATGRYRASWRVEGGGRGSRVVSSSEPYGQRLEHGFSGTDALGRHYSQAPQPHVDPAADEVEGLMVEHFTDIATRGL
jgi:hypothetical protein